MTTSNTWLPAIQVWLELAVLDNAPSV